MAFMMKIVVPLYIFAFVHATNGFSSSRNHSAGHIYPRVNPQELKNLDQEQPHIDQLTGSQQEKSRILTGIGPKEAEDRWWDWDESCSDEQDRTVIVQAFQNTISLAEQASSHIDTLRKTLPKPGSPIKDVVDNRRHIWNTDQAFAQMFGGHPRMIDYVQESFDLVTSRARSFQARNTQNPGLRFVCDKRGIIKGTDGSNWCGDAHAITVVPGSPVIEPRYQFQRSSSIVFCPPFFDDAEFPSFAVRTKQAEHTLDKIDCKERILLHEYMHLPWTRDMDPRAMGFKDYIGFLNSARVGKWGMTYSKVTPDCYAWYALYSYFNNEKGGCGDVWPKGPKKLTTKP